MRRTKLQKKSQKNKNKAKGATKAKARKIPLRKSVVSGEIIDKRDLLRIVKNKEGQVFIDPTGKANGRGAYIKLDNEEAIQAKKRHVFDRSFSMEVAEEFYDELIAYVDHKVKRRELGLEQKAAGFKSFRPSTKSWPTDFR